MKILVIDQDPRTRRRLKRVLENDYIVDFAQTASEGELLAYSNAYDLILLDLYLPDVNGDDFCAVLKSRLKDVPIIMISTKTTIADKENALNKGADDFIEKPFNSRELRARIKAVSRRRGKPTRNPILSVRNLKYNVDKRLVTYKGKRLKLRRKELQLLEFLLINKGIVVTRSEILENVWDMNINPFTNTVEVHIKRLRDKIEKPFNEKYIETIHGIGYIIDDEVE